MPMNDNPFSIDALCRRLEDYVGSYETDERMEEATAALVSNSTKLQIAAAKALGSWGGDRALEKLKNALLESYKNSNRFQLRGAIILELSTCIRDQDADWLLDLFFSVQGIWNKHELLPAVIGLAPDIAGNRLFAEIIAKDRDNRHAAMKAIAHMDYPERNRLLEIFENDNDAEIRRSANEYLGSITSKQIRKALFKD